MPSITELFPQLLPHKELLSSIVRGFIPYMSTNEWNVEEGIKYLFIAYRASSEDINIFFEFAYERNTEQIEVIRALIYYSTFAVGAGNIVNHTETDLSKSVAYAPYWLDRMLDNAVVLEDDA